MMRRGRGDAARTSRDLNDDNNNNMDDKYDCIVLGTYL